MVYALRFNINSKIYLRDPESSEIGKQIIKKSIDLIYDLGFEQFTFKKLAAEINSTEATVYRYFENKHRLLLYLLNWYWYYLAFLLEFKLQNVTNNKDQLKIVLSILTSEFEGSTGELDYDKKYLHQIIISESSKAYLVKEVNEINKNEVFKPYKELCSKIADIISAYNSQYKYPRSLSTTLIEASHHQQYFSVHLPRLTDVGPKSKPNFTYQFLEDMVFKLLA